MSYDDLGPPLIQSMWVEFAVSTVIFTARLYTRGFLVKNVARDDYTMAFSYVSNPGYQKAFDRQ